VCQRRPRPHSHLALGPLDAHEGYGFGDGVGVMRRLLRTVGDVGDRDDVGQAAAGDVEAAAKFFQKSV